GSRPDADPRGRTLSKYDEACPSMSGSQWNDGGIACTVSHSTEELPCSRDRPLICENPRQMVDRAFGFRNEGAPRGRMGDRRRAHSCDRALPRGTPTCDGAARL